jgi:dienelactone hydrolase
MPTDRWDRLGQIFTQAAEQPAERRAEFLASVCGPDAALRDEIASLLTALEHSGDFLGSPALEVFASQIRHEGWSVRAGDRIGSYIIERRLGAGGMGEVWRARDERLGRDVAIKLLLPHPSNAAERLEAFQREARAAGALNHTNVLTVHDVGEQSGSPFIVTECLEGEPLRARLGDGALPVDAALDVAIQLARGLGAAHRRGVVHRDLKPDNIFLALDGRVKILDFGLATLHDVRPTSSLPPATEPGQRPLAGGTAGYMAPEQLRGQAVDHRADIFALGAVLQEMITGSRPDTSALATASPEVPPALSAIISQCLADRPEDRFQTVAEVEAGLDSIVQSRNAPGPPGMLALMRRPAVIGVVLLVILVLAAVVWKGRTTSNHAAWARTVAAPEARRLLNRGDYTEAFLLARQALDVLPGDPPLQQLWLDVSIPSFVTTDAAGADVAFTAYRTPSPDWIPLGRTPLDTVRVPRGMIRLRISKPGFQPIEVGVSAPAPRYRLDPLDTAPPGMVRVVGGSDPVRFGVVGELEDFWIDRLEVTNKQFKAFIDLGGYQRQEFWREPFVDAGRTLRWEDGVSRFLDSTGRPGPATWSSGTYPPGQDDFPVAGVSWYEASAFAAFAGKSLPTVYHWFRAAGLGRFADILTISNFDGKPAAAGSYRGLGLFGTYDMAGNVKEWASTATTKGRFLLGGGWNEPRHMFGDYDAREPFERGPASGFRLAKYATPLPPRLADPVHIETLGRDARTQPVGDDIFDVYRRQYAYDRAPLNAVVEATSEVENGVKQTIAFDGAHGGARLRAYLFLPSAGSPPYQTVVFFPAADAFRLRSSRDLSLAWGRSIIRSGRAFLYPVYAGTYERELQEPVGAHAERDLRIAWSRDLGRAIDFLETRQDIDASRLAFYGVSAGADAGVILTALEPRLKASVLQGTGLWRDSPPEIDLLNYAPRVRMPTLVLNGRYDFELPYDTAQGPLFDLLGTPPGDKRHVVFDTGHALPSDDVEPEILRWLDRYLGPVVREP